VRANEFVAQVSNLLYRRLPVGRAFTASRNTPEFRIYAVKNLTAGPSLLGQHSAGNQTKFFFGETAKRWQDGTIVGREPPGAMGACGGGQIAGRAKTQQGQSFHPKFVRNE
jgi:hypothetical protein